MPKKITWWGGKEAKFPGVRKNWRDYDWLAHDALSDEIPNISFVPISASPPHTFLTYKSTDLDEIIVNKATKTGPTVNGNIALLDTETLGGDIVDSGHQLEDFSITEFDGGVFDDTQEY